MPVFLNLFFADGELIQGVTVTVAAVIAFVFIGIVLAGMILYVRKKLVSTEEVTISINDDEKLTKKDPGGQTLLSALTKEGIAVPSPCGGKATCKQCRLQVLEGKEEPLETDKATFTKRELQEGWRL